LRFLFGEQNSPNLDSAFSLVPVFFGNQVANSLFFGCQVGRSDFFVANFAYNILEKNILSQNHYHKNPKAQERDFLFKNSQKISTTAYTMGQGVLKIFLFSYSEYRQIWLNTLMDDHHLSNITKLIFFFKHW
jgi:hypothetical protein